MGQSDPACSLVETYVCRIKRTTIYYSMCCVIVYYSEICCHFVPYRVFSFPHVIKYSKVELNIYAISLYLRQIVRSESEICTFGG